MEVVWLKQKEPNIELVSVDEAIVLVNNIKVLTPD